jgi:hypothetical protein
VKLLKFLPAIVLYTCVATVVVEAGAVGAMSMQGMLTRERLFQCLAALYGVNLREIEEEALSAAKPPLPQQPAYEEIVKQRALAARDLDLRESAIDKALADMRALTAQLKMERERYDQLKLQFDARLAALEEVFADTALQEVQRTLEAINPKQAKDQILRMLEEASPDEQEEVTRDVITMFKSMPIDKRKKIVGEFKTEEEAAKLHEILKDVREGIPDLSLIRSTRAQLAEFSPAQLSQTR